MSGLTDFSNTEYEDLKVMTAEYKTVDRGYRTTEPIVQLFCRNGDGERRYVEVEGFYPYFYITEDEFLDSRDDIINNNYVRNVDISEDIATAEDTMNGSITVVEGSPLETLHGDDLVKVETLEPEHVAEIRDNFEKTWEADIFFTDRFLISTGIYRGIRVPIDEERVHVSDIEPADDVIEDVTPRMVTIDIEVLSDGGFPNVEFAEKPITVVTAHDSYDDEYYSAILHPKAVDGREKSEWPTYELLNSDEAELHKVFTPPEGVDKEQVELDIFDDEAAMIAATNKWIIEKDPDLLSGWNSSENDIGSGFDYPYYINRARNINEWSIEDLSPTETVFTTKSGRAVIGGKEMFDMLQGYKKTQIHEKRSYSLNYIASEEVNFGKEDIEDIDEAWRTDPEKFVKYNIRDVQAVVEIERSKSVLDMYDHLREITGTSYKECIASNIGIIDILFIRRANEMGYALPTSEKPDRGWYYGGQVYNPAPGRHENVVYPDLASLYPYLMWSLNVSPETVFDSLDEASDAGYREDQLYRAFVDRRDDGEKRNDDPQRSEIYYTKPEVKEGFVREVLTEMTEMKYEYKKDEYSDERYDAVKRIVNSTYGVFGDSNTYGKGFRLYDWRLAETITLAGRDVLEYTSDTFVDSLKKYGNPDAERIGGDTDSVMTKIPSLDIGTEEIQEDWERMQAGEAPQLPLFKAVQYVNKSYDEFMEDRFWIDDSRMHKMEVEIESYASSIFFLRDFKSNDPNKGVKKRYSQLIEWDEGTVIENPSPETKGFELVRSDTAEITAETQEEVLRIVLEEEDPESELRSYLKDVWDSTLDGDIDPSEIGVPSKVNDPLEEYGGPDKNGRYYTPQPHIRGAKYANAHIEGENITPGDKPLMFYVDRVGYPYPDIYVYDKNWNRATDDVPQDETQQELGQRVNAIALNDVRNLPESIYIDYEKMAEKTIKGPINPIIKTLGFTWSDVTEESKQTGLSGFM